MKGTIRLAAAILLLALAGQGGVRARDDARVTLAVAGDVLFDRGVRKAIERGGDDALFDGVREELSRADLAVVNLECPLTTRGLRAAKPFSFRAEPERAGALARAGVDVVTLANNHTLDYGRTALLDTVAAVERAGMLAVGAGRDRAAALRPRIVERNGLRIAFLGYCDLFIEGTTPRADAPGVASGDRDALVAAIAAARKDADAVVVLVHWGTEYRARPTESQRAFADRMLEAGATAIFGAHPHVLQPVERRGDAVVAWSLGNFVFDQVREDGSDSAILRVTLSRRGVEAIDAVPLRIDSCRPAPVSGDAAERILERLDL